MRRSIQVVALIVLFSVFAVGSVFAQQVVVSSELPNDPRLEKLVSLQIEKTKLPDVLAEVSKQTDVSISVDPSKRFWAVRQRKLTLFVKDMPLKEFIRQLEQLLDYNIRYTGKPDEYGYIVWQDLRGRRAESDLAKAHAESAERYRQRVIDGAIEDASRALRLSSDEIDKVRKTDPLVAYLASDPRGRSYATIISSLPRENFDQMANGNRCNIKLDQLSPEAQTAVKTIFDISKPDAEKIWKDELDGCSPSGIVLYPNSYEDDASITDTTFFLGVLASPDGTGGGLQMDTFTICADDSDPYLMKYTPGTVNYTELNARSQRSQLVNAKNEVKDSRQLDPELQREIVFNPEYNDHGPNYLNISLKKLAESSGLNVMYEHFNAPSYYNPQSDMPQKIIDALYRVTSANRSVEWVRDGNTLRFRRDDWAEKRSSEIPDEWIASWRNSVETKLELDIDDLADIASKLSDDQIKCLLNKDFSQIDNPLLIELFNSVGFSNVSWRRKFLELYSSLTKTQRNKLLSDKGLSIDEIDSDQWSVFDGKEQIYDAAFFISRKVIPQTNEDATCVGVKVSVILNDLSPEQRTRIVSQLSAEELAKGDNEPVTISHSDPIVTRRPRKAIKGIIEQLRLSEKKTSASDKPDTK